MVFQMKKGNQLMQMQNKNKGNMKTQETKTKEANQDNWPGLRYGEMPELGKEERSVKSIKETEDSVFVEFEKYKTEETEEETQDEPEEVNVQELVEESSFGEHEDDRLIETGQLSRIFDLDRSAIDETNRSVSVIFSSETPVERNFGVEILDHNRGSVRMDRLQKRAPVLLNHNMSDQLGVVERATIDDDRKGRAVLRFGRGRLGSEIFNDVVDGIRSQVSVGYRIHKMEKADDEKLTYRAVSWEPFEISIVPTGADSMAIVGRSEDQNFKTEIIERTSKMENQIIQEPSPQVDEGKLREAVQKAELQRNQEIESYLSEHNESDLAREYIVDGRTVPEFQSAILDKIKNYKPETVHAIGLTPNETRAFLG